MLKLIFLISVFISLTLNAQWIKSKEYDETVQRGINYAYNLEYKKANEEFNKIVLKYPEHPSGYFFVAMVDWCKILVDVDNEKYDEQFFAKLEVVINKCDKILEKNKNDVSALFFKGGALGFRGRLRANRGSWILAANDGRLALPIVQDAYKLDKNNYDVLLGIGIYNYYAEIIPEKYPIVKPIMTFFPKGNKKKGIEQLEEASQKSKYANIEASYFLMQLSYMYENDFISSQNVSEKLVAKYPNNSVFARYLGRNQIALNQLLNAKKTFENILKNCNAQKNGFNAVAKREALYYLGLIDFYDLKFDESLKYFYQADEISRSTDIEGASGFMVMINLRIGYIYDLQKKRNLAIKQYKKILKFSEYEKSHSIAKKYLKEPFR